MGDDHPIVCTKTADIDGVDQQREGWIIGNGYHISAFAQFGIEAQNGINARCKARLGIIAHKSAAPVEQKRCCTIGHIQGNDAVFVAKTQRFDHIRIYCQFFFFYLNTHIGLAVVGILDHQRVGTHRQARQRITAGKRAAIPAKLIGGGSFGNIGYPDRAIGAAIAIGHGDEGIDFHVRVNGHILDFRNFTFSSLGRLGGNGQHHLLHPIVIKLHRMWSLGIGGLGCGSVAKTPFPAGNCSKRAGRRIYHLNGRAQTNGRRNGRKSRSRA